MSDRQGKNQNPYEICTWNEESNCAGCGTEGGLNCRFNWSDLLYFLILFFTPAIAAIAGIIRAGFGWWLAGWLGYMIFFFFVWEARVLCSHCPFWAEEGRILHCLANQGVIKIWRYNPAPMSFSEKIQFLVGASILVVFPFPLMIIGGEYLLAGLTLAGFTSFAFSLKKHICPNCVNFSCPLNAVPKPVVDEYLRRNPVMRLAWKKQGYQLEVPDRD
jgi:hypothetical protein